MSDLEKLEAAAAKLRSAQGAMNGTEPSWNLAEALKIVIQVLKDQQPKRG